MSSVRVELERRFDQVVRPHFCVFRRSCSAYFVCGLTGLVFAVALGVLLTLDRSLSLWVLASMVLTAVGTFLALAIITKIVVGEELLVYYHHEVAILTTVTFLLWGLGQPVPAYLDVTILGVGTFLCFGRVGCFMVGCCHGRPHPWGVRYRPDHAAVGFTPYFVGVRLFPIQLVESIWVFVTVAVGAGLVLGAAAPGEALAWYVIVYDVGRFSFEFLRGDTSRPYWGGFSEGQWTSLLLMLVVVAAELAGALPLHDWHLGATAGVVATMIAVAGHRLLRGDSRHRLLSPNHIREVAEAVEKLTGLDRAPTVLAGPMNRQPPVHVSCTSLGIQLSTGRIGSAEGEVRHFTISKRNDALKEGEARALCGVLRHLQTGCDAGRVLAGREGAFHLVVDAYPSEAQASGGHP